MSALDSLPADQRAVLSLILRQGKRYDELSGLLGIEQAAVRARARDALTALADGRAQGGEHGDELTDYLLGQQSPERAAGTRDLLARSAPARDWVRAVARELEPLAVDGLPEIPAPSARRDAAPSPRSSRLGGAILLAAAAAIVAVVLVLVLSGDDGDGGDSQAGSTPAPAVTTAAQPQVQAQVNLVPPASRRSSKALGVVLVQIEQGKPQLVGAVQGLPRAAKGGYGVWLYASASKARWLGFFSSTDDQGRLLTRGELTVGLDGFREVLVTRETRSKPERPGPIFLRGAIRAPAGG